MRHNVTCDEVASFKTCVQFDTYIYIYIQIPVVLSQQQVTTAPRLDTLPFDGAGYVLLLIEEKTLELLLEGSAAEMKGGCSRSAPY